MNLRRPFVFVLVMCMASLPNLSLAEPLSWSRSPIEPAHLQGLSVIVDEMLGIWGTGAQFFNVDGSEISKFDLNGMDGFYFVPGYGESSGNRSSIAFRFAHVPFDEHADKITYAIAVYDRVGGRRIASQLLIFDSKLNVKNNLQLMRAQITQLIKASVGAIKEREAVEKYYMLENLVMTISIMSLGMTMIVKGSPTVFKNPIFKKIMGMATIAIGIVYIGIGASKEKIVNYYLNHGQ